MHTHTSRILYSLSILFTSFKDLITKNKKHVHDKVTDLYMQWEDGLFTFIDFSGRAL